MYLIVIGILAIVLALSQPVYDLVKHPGLVMLAVAVATLLPPAVSILLTRRVLRELDRHPERPSRGQSVFSRGMLVVQALLAVCHGATLLCTDWLVLCDSVPVVGRWPLIPGLLAILPFLASIVLLWLCIYPADRAVRQIAFEMYLFRGKPLRPVWPLMQYLLYNLRHQVLFVLIPMLLILATHDVIVHYHKQIHAATGMPYATDLLVGSAALLVAVIAPAILRRVWVTQRLPDGPLRDRLLFLARRLRLRFREILVWRSGGLVVNAAVMGIVAPLRYVLITDAMLEQMDDTKIEAVFGHEAGHVKRHHILFFLLFALVSGCAVTIFSIRARGLARTDHALYEVMATLLGVALMAKWGLLFGWISRRFERQADVYGVRTLAASGLPCSQPCVVHTPAGNPEKRRKRDALCTTAAEVFGQALNEVALLNGIRPEARSWRHSSISSRSRFVQALAQDPPRLRRFERTVLAIQLAILAAAGVSTFWAAWDMGIWSTLQRWLPGAG